MTYSLFKNDKHEINLLTNSETSMYLEYKELELTQFGAHTMRISNSLFEEAKTCILKQFSQSLSLKAIFYSNSGYDYVKDTFGAKTMWCDLSKEDLEKLSEGFDKFKEQIITERRQKYDL